MIVDRERGATARTVRPGVRMVLPGGAVVRAWIEAPDDDVVGRPSYTLCITDQSRSATTRTRIGARSAAAFLWMPEEQLSRWIADRELREP